MPFSLFRPPPQPAVSLDGPDELSELKQLPLVGRAFRWLEENAAETTRELIVLNEIPAPPFHERARAAHVAKRLSEFGLSRVESDSEGNVVGVLPGDDDPRGLGPFTVISAHIDSVFPEGTNVKVIERDGRLYAPGIGDNGSGLAGLLALARCFSSVGLKTKKSLMFVGTVGEEGSGNLRGVRHLFEENPLGGKIGEFIALDGPGIERITHQALGSRRFRVRFDGPGGHSWGDFGIVNPVHALGRFIHHLNSHRLPVIPRTSCTVAIVEGGTTVNAIPQTARCDVDLRSTSEAELDRLETHLKMSVRRAHQEENQHASGSRSHLEATTTSIGNRPSGETPVDSRLVRLATEATRLMGARPHLDCSSTDSNLPISLGVPAITIGAGGKCGGCHTLDEWYDPTGRELSLQRNLLLLLGLAGLAG